MNNQFKTFKLNTKQLFSYIPHMFPTEVDLDSDCYLTCGGG